LPQPDGPINAVTERAGIVSETRSSTLCDPNHAEMLRASSVAGGRTGGDTGAAVASS
jgi:hypothetical protein